MLRYLKVSILNLICICTYKHDLYLIKIEMYFRLGAVRIGWVQRAAILTGFTGGECPSHNPVDNITESFLIELLRSNMSTHWLLVVLRVVSVKFSNLLPACYQKDTNFVIVCSMYNCTQSDVCLLPTETHPASDNSDSGSPTMALVTNEMHSGAAWRGTQLAS